MPATSPKRPANGNDRARLALDILVHGIKKYIGGYIAVMNGIDALVFTAGIGENDDSLRSRICRNMDTFGIATMRSSTHSFPKDGKWISPLPALGSKRW